MKLFKLHAGGEIANCATEATLSDLKAALKGYDMVTVPLHMLTDSQVSCGYQYSELTGDDARKSADLIDDLIKTAQEK